MQRSAALRSARLVVGSSSRLVSPPTALLSRARTLPCALHGPLPLRLRTPRPTLPIPDPRVRRSPWDASGGRRDLCASPQPEPSPKIAALVDQISALTLLEASELTDALKVRAPADGPTLPPAPGPSPRARCVRRVPLAHRPSLRARS